MGATDPARWQAWHFSWKIGATSLANVGVFGARSAAAQKAGRIIAASIRLLFMFASLITCRSVGILSRTLIWKSARAGVFGFATFASSKGSSGCLPLFRGAAISG